MENSTRILFLNSAFTLDRHLNDPPENLYYLLASRFTQRVSTYFYLHLLPLTVECAYANGLVKYISSPGSGGRFREEWAMERRAGLLVSLLTLLVSILHQCYSYMRTFSSHNFHVERKMG